MPAAAAFPDNFAAPAPGGPDGPAPPFYHPAATWAHPLPPAEGDTAHLFVYDPSRPGYNAAPYGPGQAALATSLLSPHLAPHSEKGSLLDYFGQQSPPRDPAPASVPWERYPLDVPSPAPPGDDPESALSSQQSATERLLEGYRENSEDEHHDMEEAPLSPPPTNPTAVPARASRPPTPVAPPTSDTGRHPVHPIPPDVTVSGINLRELANLQSSPLLEPPSTDPARPTPGRSKLRLVRSAQPPAAVSTAPASEAPPPQAPLAPRLPTVQLSRLPEPPTGRTSPSDAASPLSSDRSLSEGSALPMSDADSPSASPVELDLVPPEPAAKPPFSPSQSRPPSPPPRLGPPPPPGTRALSLTWPPRASQGST
jgi:hypothetical protein